MQAVELSPADAPAAVGLWEACGLTRPWNDPVSDFTRALGGPSSTVLGLRASGDGASLLGTVMVGGDGHRGWVYYLAVRPELQGQGLGRVLMHAADDWLRERDLPKIQLMVRRGNDGVVAFYERLGYAIQDVLVLGRRLDD
ncbi:MAG: GNAT family acetyltransferase [Nigerium sp.]|nr:GNAT family acetyltransferase [Nigerium sp.]